MWRNLFKKIDIHSCTNNTQNDKMTHWKIDTKVSADLKQVHDKVCLSDFWHMATYNEAQIEVQTQNLGACLPLST